MWVRTRRGVLAIENAIHRQFCTNFALNALIVDMHTLQRVSLQESSYIKPDTAMPKSYAAPSSWVYSCVMIFDD
jgi:hypothetical protein